MNTAVVDSLMALPTAIQIAAILVVSIIAAKVINELG